jgi:hypothetical protein
LWLKQQAKSRVFDQDDAQVFEPCTELDDQIREQCKQWLQKKLLDKFLALAMQLAKIKKKHGYKGVGHDLPTRKKNGHQEKLRTHGVRQPTKSVTDENPGSGKCTSMWR